MGKWVADGMAKECFCVTEAFGLLKRKKEQFLLFLNCCVEVDIWGVHSSQLALGTLKKSPLTMLKACAWLSLLVCLLGPAL